jgi:hypothetical protein
MADNDTAQATGPGSQLGTIQAAVSNIVTNQGLGNQILAQIGTTIANRANSWNITGTVPINQGGTGATTASDARTNLGLVIGTDVQAYLACLNYASLPVRAITFIIDGGGAPPTTGSQGDLSIPFACTINSVTMLALVLMVGVVIDDAIVVLENIFRFIEEKKMDPMQAAKEATREIGLAVMATTFSLVVIFLPVSFMSSISGRFLYQFGITAAAAILVSLLVSFTLTPMMSARMLGADAEKARDAHSASSRGGFYGLFDRAYTAMLHFDAHATAPNRLAHRNQMLL